MPSLQSDRQTQQNTPNSTEPKPHQQRSPVLNGLSSKWLAHSKEEEVTELHVKYNKIKK